jgi:hypothetical protein
VNDLVNGRRLHRPPFRAELGRNLKGSQAGAVQLKDARIAALRLAGRRARLSTFPGARQRTEAAMFRLRRLEHFPAATSGTPDVQEYQSLPIALQGAVAAPLVRGWNRKTLPALNAPAYLQRYLPRLLVAGPTAELATPSGQHGRIDPDLVLTSGPLADNHTAPTAAYHARPRAETAAVRHLIAGAPELLPTAGAGEPRAHPLRQVTALGGAETSGCGPCRDYLERRGAACSLADPLDPLSTGQRDAFTRAERPSVWSRVPADVLTPTVNTGHQWHRFPPSSPRTGPRAEPAAAFAKDRGGRRRKPHATSLTGLLTANSRTLWPLALSGAEAAPGSFARRDGKGLLTGGAGEGYMRQPGSHALILAENLTFISGALSWRKQYVMLILSHENGHARPG